MGRKRLSHKEKVVNMFAFIRELKELEGRKINGAKRIGFWPAADRYHIGHDIRQEDFDFVFSDEYKTMDAVALFNKVNEIIDVCTERRRMLNAMAGRAKIDNATYAELQDALQQLRDLVAKYSQSES